MNLIEECKKYVKELFDKSTIDLSYHNLEHTQHVISAAELIAENNSKINAEEKENIILAAIFHDVGYLETYKNHEERGAEIAEQFLLEKGIDASKISEVKRIILATKLGHEPIDESEMIIMDADLSHLGSEEYMKANYNQLKQELNTKVDAKLTDKDWAQSCMVFLSAHKYLTKFARDKFGKTKEENLKKINSLMEEKRKMTEPKKTKKKKKEETLKGVETMFKVSLRNHVDLSKIADNKANTLISVNAIIISIVLSALFPKLDSNPFLFYPGVTILFFTIFTIVLAILSTIPNVNRGLISKEEVKQKKGNLLFFGNFYKMSVEDYEWSMQKLMDDKDYLYSTLTRDLFYLGKVLHKKYSLLRYSYFVFVLGLFISIFVFIYQIVPAMK